jgi:FRG domain
MSISSVTLGSWNEIHSYLKPGWMYRGQKSTDWPLKTSLERCCEREKIKPKDRSYIESELLRDFRRAYYQYAEHIPSSESIIEWISLMQHHGAPTRLLDFTYSIYVAAYFALESADSNCAVWAVRAPWALVESVSAFRRIGKHSATRLQAGTRESHEKVSNQLFFKKPFAKVAVPLSPFRRSERLRTQRATFLVPGKVSDSFMANLLALRSHQDSGNFIKIEIPVTLRAEAIERLFAMNISRTSLFPGLDGYSQSLGIFHPVFRPDPYLEKR